MCNLPLSFAKFLTFSMTTKHGKLSHPFLGKKSFGNIFFRFLFYYKDIGTWFSGVRNDSNVEQSTTIAYSRRKSIQLVPAEGSCG